MTKASRDNCEFAAFLIVETGFILFVLPRLPPWARTIVYWGFATWCGYMIGLLVERGRRIADSKRHGADLARLRTTMDETIAGLRQSSVAIDQAFVALEQRVTDTIKRAEKELN